MAFFTARTQQGQAEREQPKTDLGAIADESARLVAVAKNLIAIARDMDDPKLVEELSGPISEILKSSKAFELLRDQARENGQLSQLGPEGIMPTMPEGARSRANLLLEQLVGPVPSAEEAAQRAQDTVADQVSRREADDRSWIAKRIIGVFVAMIFAGLAILVVGAAMTDEWQNAGDQSVDLIKSTVLPVVTLVLGYYFGRSGKG